MTELSELRNAFEEYVVARDIDRDSDEITARYAVAIDRIDRALTDHDRLAAEHAELAAKTKECADSLDELADIVPDYAEDTVVKLIRWEARQLRDAPPKDG